MSEHDEQVTVVRWFKLQYPNYKDCIMAIPNGSVITGGAKGMGRYKWMLSEGFKSGVSDLFIAVPSRAKHGMWLEMKDVNKTKCSVSEAQKNHLTEMLRVGYEATWAAGSKEAIDLIKKYMSDI